MLDPLDFENRPFLDTLGSKRRRAFFVLSAENLVLYGWRLFFWILLFCGLWMLEIPRFFGEIISFFIAVVFIAGLITLIRRDLLSYRMPTQKDIDKALEKKSEMPQGHISVLDDSLANPKKRETRTLWDFGQKAVLHSFNSLKTPHLRGLLTREDPSALRYLAVLIFISGILVSGVQWKQRIFDGLFPITPSYIIAQGQQTNLWVTPPDYTQVPEIHLRGYGTYSETLLIPEDSTVRVRVHNMLGSWFPPTFYNGDEGVGMTYLGEGLYDHETTIADDDTISISQGILPRAKWTYLFVKDMLPFIYLDTPKRKEQDQKVENLLEQPEPKKEQEEEEPKKPYEVLSNSQLRFPLVVKDDYGVKELHLTMNIDEMVEEADRPLGEMASDIRLVMSQPGVDFKISPIYDMTWHTWAGLPVTFEYEVFDHKGQTAKLEKINVILPERTFEHPMAKALISIRKRLAWEYRDDFVLHAQNLEMLLGAPDYFQNNPIIFLAIRSAASRLFYVNRKPQEHRTEAAKEVIKLLWHTAIAIEEGNLSLAMRELRDAQRVLENAMRDPNATQDEIDSLMENLREKMSNYFAEMQREIQKRMANGEDFPQMAPEDFGQMISPNTFQQMMEDIEKALREGDQQKAQELMSQMQRLMEMMDPSLMPQMPMDMQVMQEGVNELQELIERQEKLLGQTEEQARTKRLLDGRKQVNPRSSPTIDDMLKDFGIDALPPAPEPEQQTDTGDLKVDTLPNKTEQEALRYILGQLMLDVAEHVEDIPESMGKAEQEMRGSSGALELNDPDTSIPHQEKAIEYLKESQQQLQQQFQQRMQQMVGMMPSGGQRYDPLGRPYGEGDEDGQAHGSRVKVPDEAEKKRVDEILRTLRERSGDRSRPDEELDYFRRLLRQF